MYVDETGESNLPGKRIANHRFEFFVILKKINTYVEHTATAKHISMPRYDILSV